MLRGVTVGLSVCEDIWSPVPTAKASEAGARLLLNLNASPFHTGKAPEREELVQQRSRENRIPIVYVNLVGGQDELVFDGGSFVLDARGQLVRRLPFYTEAQASVEFNLEQGPEPLAGEIIPHLLGDAAVYEALVLGVRDYVRKNGFNGAILGLSGGIDSALTLG